MQWCERQATGRTVEVRWVLRKGPCLHGLCTPSRKSLGGRSRCSEDRLSDLTCLVLFPFSSSSSWNDLMIIIVIVIAIS